MKKNLEKNRGEGYGKENEDVHDKDEEGTRRFEAIHLEDEVIYSQVIANIVCAFASHKRLAPKLFDAVA